MAPHDTGTVAVRNILTRLCKRSGLSADRLRTTEIDVAPLLELPVIRRRAHRDRAAPEAVVAPVVRELAARLAPSDRFIVDAALALGLWRAEPPAGVDPDRLYAPDLGERRASLAEYWHTLHAATDADPNPPELTVRSLRTNPERRAFTALAALLDADPGYGEPGYGDHGYDDTDDATARSEAPAAHTAPLGRITVVGDAVIDHIYRTDRLPAEDAPAKGRFAEHLGGKGLNRAVAAARLGFRVQLMAAVGDDPAGRRILRALRREDVGTDLVRIAAGEPTPVAALIVTATGAYGVIGRGDDAVRLSAEDLTTPAALAALTDCDALLLTFEQPTPVLEQVLRLLRAGARTRPRLFVQPTPPLEAPQYLYEFFDRIDYLIGTPGELAQLVGADPAAVGSESEEQVVHRLRALGVDCVCVVEGLHCRVRSAALTLDVGPPAPPPPGECPRPPRPGGAPPGAPGGRARAGAAGAPAQPGGGVSAVDSRNVSRNREP
ncbi:PfkB family carbohydrate kinase [Nocardia farcinica]|uniref:PfkB family carbohydrate kinase n=1 Tax=Nocardia farcinica TaxID=37329 RepID=UPI002456B190|nr:PfkB family carbohydrate kinase [Nocardia farcinica]